MVGAPQRGRVRASLHAPLTPCEPQRTVGDYQRTVVDRQARIGTALRRMAEDLVAARRRVADLERQNRQLRARLETVERTGDMTQSSVPQDEPRSVKAVEN